MPSRPMYVHIMPVWQGLCFKTSTVTTPPCHLFLVSLSISHLLLSPLNGTVMLLHCVHVGGECWPRGQKDRHTCIVYIDHCCTVQPIDWTRKVGPKLRQLEFPSGC